MKKVVISVLAALVLVLPNVSAAQKNNEPITLPPCIPGDGTFLFANWPCDPNAISPWPTPSPTISPCPPCPSTGNTPCRYLLPCRPPPPPCWWRWPCPRPVNANYVALGDSVAYGLIAFKGYVFRYQEGLEERLNGTVDTQNMSAPGVSSEALLANLTSNTMMQERLAQANYVTWNVGGKDLLDARAQYQSNRCGGKDNQNCLRRSSQNLKTNWDGILAKIQSLRQPHATVTAMDIYNPFVDEDNATDSWPNDAGSDFDVFKPYLDDINQHLRNSTIATNLHFASVYTAFNGPAGTRDPELTDLISFDGLHPNDKGHTLIADLIIGPRPLVAR